MSRQFRYRVTAVVLSGLIFGAPLLLNGTARADPLDPEDRRVSFTSDGVLGLTCESKPSVESLRVPADSVVRVQNRTGHDAQLKLGGTEKGTIPEGGFAGLLFRRGTTAVLLTPECDNGEAAVPMMVTAEPSVTFSNPDPAPAPTGGNAAQLTKPSGGGTRTKAGAALPGSSASRPARDRRGPVRSGTRKPSAARPPAATGGGTAATEPLPQRDTNPRVKVDTMPGTGIGAPTFMEVPPGIAGTVVPSAPPAGPAVPRTASATPTAPTATDLPVGVTGEPVSAVASEPVAAVGPIRQGRPLGLLGLTALICVLGVATAAIRAIVSQRAS